MQKLFVTSKSCWGSYTLRIVCALALLGVLAVLVIRTPGSAAFANTVDWPTFLGSNTRTGFNGAETVINPSTAHNLKKHWSRAITAAISSEPIVANGMLYWGSWNGNEHASSLTDGHDIWNVNLGTSVVPCDQKQFGVTGASTIATVTIGGVQTKVDFVAGGNSNFYALNANTGAVIWHTPLGATNSFLFGSPAVFNGSVYIGIASLGDCPLVQGKLFKLQATTGKIQHTFNVVPSGCLGGALWGSPAIDSATNIIYFGTGNGGSCSTTETMTEAVIALHTSDLSLVGSWQIPKAQESKDGDFGSTPTFFRATIKGVQHNMLGLINKNGIYYALDRANISSGPLWHVRLAAPSSGKINNISSSTWNNTTLYAVGAQTTINGTTCTGSLRALNPASGAFLWQDCLNKLPLDPAITVPGLVVVGFGNTFNVDNASNGKVLFTFQDTNTNSKFQGAATIVNGVLYQGNNDGMLYAFGM